MKTVEKGTRASRKGVKSSSDIHIQYTIRNGTNSSFVLLESIGGALYAQLWKITTAEANQSEPMRCRKEKKL